VTPAEQTLLERAQRGDRAAFGQLVRPHLSTVRRFAEVFARRGLDADDLAQEALLKAYRSLGGFRGDAKLTTWLYAVTRSVGLDSLRSRPERERRLEAPLEPSLPAEEDDQEALLAGKDEAERLWAALRRLDPEFRVALVLSDVEGLTYEEIAEVEGIPVGTVRSRISRGRAHLLDLLNGKHRRPSNNPGTVVAVLPSKPERKAAP